ncbi:hypothetical protein GAG66_17675 [Bacteroides thetaiotaomicron]|nr:hypothetical protein GAG66_17675 [Bacteroides thetaiotaomicron]
MDCSSRKELYLKPIGELTYSVLKAGCKRVTKNGTTTPVVVPSQHKHKIKHDKTTMQSYLSMA